MSDTKPSEAGLIVQMRGRALWVTLHNPPLNPITGGMQRELGELLRRADGDPAIKVVVLTGSGRGFSAGGDITEMKAKATDIAHHMNMMGNGIELVHALLALRKPLVARLNGHAIGLGASIALLCDITIAAHGVKIGDPHVRMGLAAGDGGALIWPHLIGVARAKEFLMTGASLEATEAARIGLINHAVPAAELDAKVDEFVSYFEKGPALAISATKVAINQYLRQYAMIAVEAHMGLEGRTIFSDDHQEAVDAFLENREPKFQ